MEPDAADLLNRGLMCVHMLAIVLAGAGGIFGALKARKDGAAGLGPLLMAAGFGLAAAVAVWFGLFEALLGESLDWSILQPLLVLGMMGDFVATLVLLAGLALLRGRVAGGES